MTSRRQVLGLLAGAGLPGLLVAQPAASQPRVGVLMSGNRASAAAWLQAFRNALAASGGSAAVELRFADGKLESLPGLAAELAKRGVVALVATDDASFRAAKAAGGATVLMGSAITPVDVAPQELDLLAAFLPKLSRIGVLVNPENSSHKAFFNAIGAAAGKKGWRALGVELEYIEDFQQSFDDMRKSRVGAVVIADDGLFSQNVVYVASLARERRMATVGQQPGYASGGCLFSCGEDYQPRFEAIAAEVVRLVKGGKPAEHAEFRAPRVPVVVNRSTAKALGLRVPPEIQKIATFVKAP